MGGPYLTGAVVLGVTATVSLGGWVERWTWQVGHRRQNQVSSGILWAQDSGWGEVPSWTAALRLGDCGFA